MQLIQCTAHSHSHAIHLHTRSSLPTALSVAMEILGLIGAAAGVATIVKKVVGPSQSEPLYTLTPPVFDRHVTANASVFFTSAADSSPRPARSARPT